MKRMRILGAALVAVFAIVAVAASSASAALPEYRTCIKAEKNEAKEYVGGEFTEKNCATKGTPTTNKYKLGAWNQGKKIESKGKGKNPVNKSYDPSKAEVVGEVECKKEAVAETLIGPKENEIQSTWTGCHAGAAECNNQGEGSGKIIGNKLVSTLIYLDAAKTKVGVKIKPASGNVLAEYSCAAKAVTVVATGETIGEVQGQNNKFEKTNKTVLENNGSVEQKYLYAEEKGTTTQALEFLGYVGNCKAKKEAFPEPCLKNNGPWPDFPNVPSFIISEANIGTAPATQEGQTENKGENLEIQS